MDKIFITHYGEDYATLTVDGKDFEITLGLASALDSIGVEQKEL